ncbi:MAG: hypothetical protein H6872_10520 [Methylobacteriaceae bacterium]|nr:hypothetical protein [Rhodoblastus sp.]MCC0005552.1 hypothetical protein [Methylobacteriaceae bacterium]
MSRQDLKLFLLGLVGTLLIGSGAWLLVDMLQAPAPQEAAAPPVVAAPETATKTAPPVDSARTSVEETIASAPDVARFFDRLRLALPSDYEAAIGALVARRSSGATDSPDFDLSQAVKTLRQSRGALAAKSDGATLGRVFDAQLAVLKALSSVNSRLCVDFLYGGASEAFLKFSSENRGLVTDLAIAGLEAILDGKEKNVARTTPTESDFQMFETSLRQNGVGTAEIGALLDGKTPDPPISDDRMCAAGKTYLETLQQMPEDVRGRIQALAIDLMARS